MYFPVPIKLLFNAQLVYGYLQTREVQKKNIKKIHYYLKGQILHWWTHFKHMAVMVFYNVYQSIDNVPMYSYVCTDIISFTIRCIHI